MREIIFRGKRKDNGEWVEGYYYHEKIMVDDTKNHDYIIGRTDGVYFKHWCITETISEFTGLTDKNGKKIFEGDILRIGYCFGWDSEQEKKVPEEEYISKVYSIDCCPFCVDLQHCDGDMSPVAWLDWSYDDTEIEVIGNIHDNPELLKGGENG